MLIPMQAEINLYVQCFKNERKLVLHEARNINRIVFQFVVLKQTCINLSICLSVSIIYLSIYLLTMTIVV